MDYYKITVISNDPELREISIAELADVGVESFDEFEGGINVYMPEPVFDEAPIKDVFEGEIFAGKVSYTVERIKSENWNAVWESGYKPVIVDGKCIVYTSFHRDLPPAEYKILINPEMTFGTGHHETTHLCIEALLKLDLNDKTVLDMGCGTGVLAVLAAMKGATAVTAVDNDPTAAENAAENIKLNEVADKAVALVGDAKALSGKRFDIIVANINRNVLLSDTEIYADCLSKAGTLILSGFYKEDVPLILDEAESRKLSNSAESFRNGWACLQLTKY